MDGDVAPLKEIEELATKYNALMFLDECHATGFIGKTGRGTEELFGFNNRVDLINSTLGKALGGAMGGYTTGPQEFIDLLRQKSRPYLFSNSLAPSIVGSSMKVKLRDLQPPQIDDFQVFDMLIDHNTLAGELHKNVDHFRGEMNKAGFKVLGNPTHPICPVLLGDARLAEQFAKEMLNEGIYVIGFSYPVVPVGKARIRVQISAAHTTDQIEKCIGAFKKIGRKLSVIS